jgi:YgiT-type zinc finger domain-containing protein
MRRRYQRCHVCGGRVTERAVVVDYRWGGELVAIIQHVPAGVCDTCGERYFRSAVVKAMERTAHSPAKPHTVVAVPVRQLADG